MAQTYQYIAWEENGIWTAQTPSMPGCYGIAKTRRGAIADLVVAIREMNAYLEEISSPKPRRRVAFGTLELAWLKREAARRGVPMHELVEQLVSRGNHRPWSPSPSTKPAPSAK